LQALLAAEPRFHEIEFAQGQALVARQRLDDADAVFDKAYRWHQAWPTLTLAIANVGMTAEEFERSVTMYDETLKYEPQAVDALLGKVRALTFLGRNEQAIATVDLLLAERWYVGDGRYWRAVNETQLERFDDAWTDIELAAKLWSTLRCRSSPASSPTAATARGVAREVRRIAQKQAERL
jgi:tetratricopeptide (TPR) repeat protein